MTSRCKLLVTVALAAAGVASGAAAPDWRRSNGGGGDAESRVARRMQKAERLIRWFDSNQDGVIEPNEVHGQGRYVYERMAKEAGLDPTHSVSVGEFRTALARHFQKLASPEAKTAASDKPAAHGTSRHAPAKPGSASSGDKPAPKVAGFGVEGESPKVGGFEQPASGGSPSASSGAGHGGGFAGAPTSGQSPSKPAEKTELDARIRKYAESLLRRYDANKNGVLEKDEWSKMRGSPEKGDRNRDGVITVEELTIRLSEYGRKSPSSGSYSSSATVSTSTGRSRSSYSSGSSHSGERKSYRFLTPTERLPKGLPEWFARKDADGDGQVSMAESSSFWDDAKAAEFGGYDLNNDGVITPAECLKAASSP